MDENNNQEIIQQLSGNLNDANSVIISSIARSNDPTVNDRRYKIAKVVTDLNDQRRKTVLNSVVTAVSLASFVGCSLVAANNLGIFLSTEEIQAMGENVSAMLPNASSMVESLSNEFLMNVGTFEEASKQLFTMENVKAFFSELGAVGYVSGLFSLIGTRRLGKNVKKINELNKEFNAIDAVYSEDCDFVRCSLARRSRERIGNFFRNVGDFVTAPFVSIGEHAKSTYKKIRNSSKVNQENMEQLYSDISLSEYTEGRSR